MPQELAHALSDGAAWPSEALVFVYGTLRRGGSNDIAQLGERARWRGRARVRGQLHDLGGYPGLVLGRSDWVVGELYGVDPEAQVWLDRLEEVWPQRSGEYRRVQALVVHEGLNLPCRALLYEMDSAVARAWPRIPGGDWIAHQASRPI